ncbi:unnamed protein product [Adineta steineri]|uniref:Uncharacterized protein n=1 Tax=Adineta steineri TaxID=433720 RepID=A0A813RK79_9BILA|nr:unnamed protein product [Adineta steineri]CAF0829896.1 unnamed protein product [Adineta steineri]CAF3805266.1 unnamed protein product [Adineta steineri]
MHLIIWFIGFSFLTIINGKDDACLHNESKGKHCTSDTRSVLQRILTQPTAIENQECHTLCIQSGYDGGGYCSISDECFRFCSCHHSINITVPSLNE